eukprot:1217018-Pleurochrysis_carterae.AAC.2
MGQGRSGSWRRRTAPRCRAAPNGAGHHRYQCASRSSCLGITRVAHTKVLYIIVVANTISDRTQDRTVAYIRACSAKHDAASASTFE